MDLVSTGIAQFIQIHITILVKDFLVIQMSSARRFVLCLCIIVYITPNTRFL